jgi:hypothetical protein
VAQQERNRNLSKSPKRFGIFDLAIESSVRGLSTNHFTSETIESALQHTLLAVQQIFTSNQLERRVWSAIAFVVQRTAAYSRLKAL